jgi:glucose-1-phosphate thymidylyltransferase
VSLAVIDATAADAGPALSARYSTRYATPIANAPLIGHVFGELAASGIERACIVTSARVHRDLEQLLHAGTTRGIDVSYRDAPEGEGRIALLSEVEEALSAGPVLMHPGDCLFGSQIAVMWERFQGGDVDSVLPAQGSAEPLRSPAQRRASDSAVLLGPATRPLLEDLITRAGAGNDLVDTLVQSECRLAVCEQGAQWRYSSSTDSLLAANRMLLDQLPDTAEAEGFGENNQFHGRIAVSPSAFISNCVLYGPVSIADRAVLEDSFIGPYTAIGPGATVSGTEIDNAMVLADAQVRHPGSRIEASIIGERSRVVRSFDLPQGIHLRLPPNSSVTLS